MAESKRLQNIPTYDANSNQNRTIELVHFEVKYEHALWVTCGCEGNLGKKYHGQSGTKSLWVEIYVVSDGCADGKYSKTDIWLDEGLPGEIEDMIRAHLPEPIRSLKGHIQSIGDFEVVRGEQTVPFGEYYFDFEQNCFFVQPVH